MADHDWIDEIARKKATKKKLSAAAQAANQAFRDDLERLEPAFWNEFATEIEAIVKEVRTKIGATVELSRDDANRSIRVTCSGHLVVAALDQRRGVMGFRHKTPNEGEKSAGDAPALKVVGDQLKFGDGKTAAAAAEGLMKSFFKRLL